MLLLGMLIATTLGDRVGVVLAGLATIPAQPYNQPPDMFQPHRQHRGTGQGGPMLIVHVTPASVVAFTTATRDNARHSAR